MSACQLAECFITANKLVLYVNMNSNNAAMMTNNNWTPIEDENTNIIEISNKFKKMQLDDPRIPYPGLVLQNDSNSSLGQKVFPTSIV